MLVHRFPHPFRDVSVRRRSLASSASLVAIATAVALTLGLAAGAIPALADTGSVYFDSNGNVAAGAARSFGSASSGSHESKFDGGRRSAIAACQRSAA